MTQERPGRRGFIAGLAGAAMIAAWPNDAVAIGAMEGPVREDVEAPGPVRSARQPKIRFAVIGINHNHITAQVGAVIRGGGEFAAVYAQEPDLLAAFTKQFPQARVARSEAEILEDRSIQLVLSSIVPVERAPLGIRVMQHGKDYMADKPGIITLEQVADVRRVQAATKQIYSIMYSERLENRATVKAAELVRAGAIGRVIQTVGLGPHRINPPDRPEWFWHTSQYGGILCDIGSHQGDQFLYFTGSTRAEVVASQVGNVHHPDHPEFEDFGDVMLRGDGGTGYIRLDWFTPAGLSTWGDGRLTILGTDGFIEVRKNNDLVKATGDSHLYIVDQKETRYIDCRNVDLPYGPQLVSDVVNRTETAMSQEHCFLATEIMLRAQAQASHLPFANGHLPL